MAALKNYRINLGKYPVTLQMTEETKKRDYPSAVEVTRSKPAPKAEAPSKDNEPEPDPNKEPEKDAKK